MKSIFAFLSAIIALGTGCQPNSVAPSTPNSPAMRGESTGASVAIWVAVDDPGELRSPPEIFQIAAQRVVPNLKKLPGASDVRILGSDKQLAISDDMATALIKVSLQPSKAAASDFRHAMTEMDSLPVAVNIVLDETLDSILMVELLPEESSPEPIRKIAERATEIVQDIQDVAHVVTHFDSDNPNVATVLVKQKGDGPTATEMRQVLDRELKGVKFNVTEKPRSAGFGEPGQGRRN